MAPSPAQRGPDRSAGRGDRSARGLRAFAQEAERDRSDPEQLRRLLRNAATGDPQALERVFNENLAMLLRHARERAGGELTEDELVQEGSAAMVEAIREYAGRDGGAAGLAGFLRQRVAEGIQAAIDEHDRAAREQSRLLEDAELYERAEISIRRDKKREATLEELAEKLEWSPEKTRLLGEMVAQARRQHDEELLLYVDPEELAEFDDE